MQTYREISNECKTLLLYHSIKKYLNKFMRQYLKKAYCFENHILRSKMYQLASLIIPRPQRIKYKTKFVK